MSDDDRLEQEFADVLGVLRRFEPAAAAAGFEGRVEEKVTMILKQKPIEPIGPGVPVEAREVAGISLRCAYCHASLLRDEASFCAACLAPHHVECWVEHGRCTAPGCSETRVVRPREGGQQPKYRATRRWARLLVVTAGLAGVMGFVVAFREYRASVEREREARVERALFEEFVRLKREALLAFQEFNRSEKSGNTAVARAEYAEARSKLVQAMDLITKLLDKHRDPATGFTHRDFEGYEVDQSEIAEILVDLEKRRPADPDPHLALAARELELSKIAANEGRVVEATEHLRRAVELDPTNAKARELLAKLEPLADGMRALNDSLARDPFALTAEASVLLDQGRIEEALAKVERVLMLDPTSGFAYTVRAKIRVAKGDLDGALADLSKAIELGPTADAYRLRGRVTLGRGDLESALMDLLKAGDLEPGAPGALADFDRALALDPTSDRAYYGRARAKVQHGDDVGARADLDRAIELNPTVADSWLLRGEIRQRLGDPEGAKADAANAAKLNARHRR